MPKQWSQQFEITFISRKKSFQIVCMNPIQRNFTNVFNEDTYKLVLGTSEIWNNIRPYGHNNRSKSFAIDQNYFEHFKHVFKYIHNLRNLEYSRLFWDILEYFRSMNGLLTQLHPWTSSLCDTWYSQTGTSEIRNNIHRSQQPFKTVCNQSKLFGAIRKCFQTFSP